MSGEAAGGNMEIVKSFFYGQELLGAVNMGELETSLAVLFKRKGKNVITETEFIFTVSFDFRWFTPKEAQVLLDLALKRGLLSRTEEFLKPTFDYKDVEASLSFRPSKEVLVGEAEAPSLFAQLIHLISEKGGMKKRDAVAKINRAQEKLGVDVEVAAILVAKEMGLDVEKYIEPAREEVRSR